MPASPKTAPIRPIRKAPPGHADRAVTMMACPRSLPLRWPLLLVAGLVVAACGTAPKSGPTQLEPGSSPALSPAPTAATPAAETADDNEEETLENRREDADSGDAGAAGEDRTPRINLPKPDLGQLASVPPAADLPGPLGLIGMGAEALRTVLGEPDFMRRDAPAELWQYHGEDCFLDLFLYEQASGGGYRITHMEARGRTVASVPLRECYFSLFGEGSRQVGN